MREFKIFCNGIDCDGSVYLGSHLCARSTFYSDLPAKVRAAIPRAGFYRVRISKSKRSFPVKITPYSYPGLPACYTDDGSSLICRHLLKAAGILSVTKPMTVHVEIVAIKKAGKL